MALTQAQWYEKLKGFVPSWFFETENLQKAYFMALAKTLEAAQLSVEALNAETFIAQATAEYVDLHGSERNLTRVDGEADLTFSTRIRNIVNQSNKPALEALINALLVRGTAEIREGWSANNAFLSRGTYADRNEYFNEYHYNVFTVLMQSQPHLPWSFMSRENFCNRGAYAGSPESDPALMQAIQDAIDAAKALGVMYKIVITD